jgi:hypothetical protein
MKPSQKHADKIFYEMAGSEIESGQIDKGLMVKAISKSGGDKKKAELIYLEWRIELLKEQAVEDAERAERKRAEDARRAELKKVADDAKAVEEARILTEKRVAERLERERKKEVERKKEYEKHQKALPWYRKDWFLSVIVPIVVTSLIIILIIYLGN